MIDVFKSLRTLLKISRVHIDNSILRLHYSLTVIILLAFCVIVTTKQYVGDPIDCVREENVPQSVINTYCWIHTTYTVPRALEPSLTRNHIVPHPGIDASQDDSEFKYHRYYQWVRVKIIFSSFFSSFALTQFVQVIVDIFQKIFLPWLNTVENYSFLIFFFTLIWVM